MPSFSNVQKLTSRLTYLQALIRSFECLHSGQNLNLGYIYKFTIGLEFLGTPHRGSEQTGFADIIAKVASAALRQPNKKLIDILKQDSDVLEAQRSSFSAISKNLPVACIYETVPIAGIGMVGHAIFECCLLLTGTRLFVRFAPWIDIY